MARRKILYLITKGTWGGAQRYVFDLVTNLPETYEIMVAYGTPGILSEKLSGVGIRTVAVPSLERDIRFGKELRALGELYRLIAREQPDIFHLNSSKAAGLGALAVRLFSLLHARQYSLHATRTIFTAHGWPFKEGRPWFSAMLLYIVTWFTVLLSHMTIVVSKDDQRFGNRMWLVKRKIHYIPLAIPAAHYLPREKAEEILFHPRVDSQVINSIRLVTIAELTKNKGLRYGIEMMKELEKQSPGAYTCTIFGRGEDLSSLQEQSREVLNSHDQPIVLFRDSTMENAPKDLSTEASRYLRAFHIFVLPSIKEGMPYVLLEAAAAGLPMIATDIVREEAASFRNIRFVRPRDGQALATAVRQLAKETQKHLAETRPPFSAMLTRTVELYEKS